MATQIKTWQIIDGQLEEIETTLSDSGRTESYDLESWIASNPSVIEQGLVIIGRQVHTESGPLDLLALDRAGNTVIIELKRDKLPREVLAQAIDYASDLSGWDIDQINEACLKFTQKSLDDIISENYPELSLETIHINESQRIILVGFAIDPSLERMINWLSETYKVNINALILHYTLTSSGDELLSKTSVLSEDIVEQRKYRIPMSDEPGDYEIQELRNLLIQYLSQNMVTSRRIKNILLPLCLESDVATRDDLKRELVARGEAEDISKAGFAQSVISGQIGLKKNDFLRQVIGYGYPNNPWEKDEYFIHSGYRDLVEEILDELSG